MDDPFEHSLVCKAFAFARSARGYVGGYVEWRDDNTIQLAREKLADLDGLTPEAVRIMSIDFVNDGGKIKQSKETDELWLDLPYKYEIILRLEGFPSGVYVKFKLSDDDPKNPSVHVVGAHRNGV